MPSGDALSTTTISRLAAGACARKASRQAGSVAAELKVTMTVDSDGIGYRAAPVNAASVSRPLAAQV